MLLVFHYFIVYCKLDLFAVALKIAHLFDLLEFIIFKVYVVFQTLETHVTWIQLCNPYQTGKCSVVSLILCVVAIFLSFYYSMFRTLKTLSHILFICSPQLTQYLLKSDDFLTFPSSEKPLVSKVYKELIEKMWDKKR